MFQAARNDTGKMRSFKDKLTDAETNEREIGTASQYHGVLSLGTQSSFD